MQWNSLGYKKRSIKASNGKYIIVNLDVSGIFWEKNGQTLQWANFSIRDQSHSWAFDSNSLISFLTVLKNQKSDNLTAQNKNGVNVQKRKGEEYFHVVVHVIQRISCSFSVKSQISESNSIEITRQRCF